MSLLLFLNLFLGLFSLSDAAELPQSSEIRVLRIRQASTYQVDNSFYLKVFEDQSCGMNLEDVQARLGEFSSLDTYNLNYKYAYWSVFKIKNESGEGLSFIMTLGQNSSVDVYEEEDTGQVTHKKTGYLTPMSERDIKHDGDAKVTLFLDAGEEKTIWTRTLQADHFQPIIRINLVPYSDWVLTTDREDLFEGVFTGFLVVLAVLGLIFFSYTKEKFFLFFGLYSLIHALYFFSFYGYVSIYIFPESPLLTQPIWVIQILAFAMYFAFARNFVNIKTLMPGWSKALKMAVPILIFTFVLITIFLLVTHNLKDAIWVKNLIMLAMSIMALAFIRSFLKTRRDQAYYLAGASTFLLLVLIFISISYFVDETSYNPLWVQSGILLELIVLSMAIGHQARANQLESKITQDSLILKFTENEKFQRNINQKLEENVAERTHRINVQKRELEKAREIAEQATLAKSEFLSVMSHEIRTPLNAIISLTHLMELENEDPDNEEYIDALKFSGESLHSLINDILDYSKIEAGKLRLESVDFSIVDLLNKINSSFKFKTQAKPIELKLIIGEYTPYRLFGDPTRLTQILNNLVSNAIKFTHEGEVSVHANLKGIKDETATITFKVSDTGIGIPQDKLKDIFEDFEQASRETTRKYGGTGLGLAITKKLLDLHDATIEIESSEGKGTTFKFDIDFKLDSGFEVFEPEVSFGKKKNLQSAKVLVVDDNDMNRLVLKRLFTKWNAEHYESKSGPDACEYVNSIKFDLILMDIEMEGQDGYETAKLIRENSTMNKETEIIAMSARGDLEAKTKAADNYMDEFIRKPFDPEVLYQKIRFSLNSLNDETH